MCGGNKGQSQQQSTYTPNPAATGAIQGAIQNAQNVASTPFQQPVAPVAGFSQDQQNAFNTVNNAQGMAIPYINSAANLFGQSAQGPNINQFFNPLAGAVSGQMQNIFGQQDVQNTGSLTQAAGGVGADRIAVGQGNLANQQGLAAGQTFANLFQPALTAAQQQQNILQGAAYGYGALGPAAQNSVLSGAQAQLGTGGLQQQLSQAQLNAPYQNELARLAYPFQTSNFLSGTIGALAPGLGGTTYGTNQAAPPNMFSQVAGAGVAGLGLYNGLNGGSNGKGSNSGASGGWYGPSSVGGAPLGQARGGAVYPFAGDAGYDEGGATAFNPESDQLPPGFNDKPINIAPQSVVPETQLTPIKANIPQLAPQGGGSASSGPSLGDMAKMGLQLATMFAKRGGAIPGYDDGGDVFGDTNRAAGYDLLRTGTGTTAPDSIPGGEPAPTQDEPYRLAGPKAMDAWRSGVDQSGDLPSIITGGTDAPATRALSYAPGRATGTGALKQRVGPETPDAVNNVPQAIPGDTGDDTGSNLAKSPWLALAAAGLGMMGGTSPYFGVNIGQGGLQGVKALEQQREAAQKDTTVKQASRRLDLEAQHYADTAKHQKWEESKPVPAGQVFDPQTGLNRTQFMQQDKDGNWKPVAGAPVTDATGEPVKGVAAQIGDSMISGEQPPTTTGLGRMTPQVRAYLASQKFDLAKAQMEWARGQKQIQALNGPQMTRGYNLYQSVNSTIDEVKDLSEQMKLGGFPLLNKMELQGYVSGVKGSKEQQALAVRYITAVNTLKEEFANLANGGYAPTEPAWALANEQVNGNYGVGKLGSSLDEIKRLIGYRMKFIAESPVGPGAANRYTGQGASAAPAGGGGKPDAATRFGQIMQTPGMTEEKAYATLHQEGY